MFNSVTIIGVGLLGASFALSLKENSLCRTITGCGRNRENLQKAKERNIVDSFETDPAAACKDADLVVLSTPVGSFLELAKAVAPVLKRGVVLTDVGSVKGSLVRDIEKIMPEGVHYIGCHPIAGSDRSGIDAANAGLFRDAKCIITPTESPDPASLEKIKRLWKAVGSNLLLRLMQARLQKARAQTRPA